MRIQAKRNRSKQAARWQQRIVRHVSVETVPHDLAVIRLTPGLVPPGTNVTISVVVTNKTVTTESFSVILSNLTTGVRIGTLPANVGESTESFNIQMWDDTEQRFIGPMWQIPNLRPTGSVRNLRYESPAKAHARKFVIYPG